MKKGTVQVLSFVSGLTLTAVVLGVTLSRNETLRKEVDNQLNSLLSTTKSLVGTAKSLAAKASTAASFLKSEHSSNTQKTQERAKQEQGRIENQWDSVEASLSS